MRTLTFLTILVPLIGSAQLPEDLVKERTLVVMNLPLEKEGDYYVRGDWEAKANQIQSNLRYTGVDGVAYLHYDDWKASKSTQDFYKLFFATRGIKNMIHVEKEGSIYRLSVTNFPSLNEVWKTQGGSLNQVVFRLGKEIKSRGFVVENFLPVDEAEIFTDIPFSKWSATNTYPDQIRRLKIGVDGFESEEQNQKLETLMAKYPFEFELFDYSDDEDAFRKGYQFVLLNMTTSGSSIQKLLNYQGGIRETDFISTIKGDSSSTKLKTIPVNASVTKFYFRQTVNHEVFVGRDWDADVTWMSSLENFIHNLRIAFKKI